MHRNAALTTLDEHHETDDRYCQQSDGDQGEDVDIALTCRLERLPDRTRQTGHDASKNQHRDTVADTALSDLFAQPHHEHRTSHEGGDSHEVEAEISRESDALAGQTNGHAD